MNTLEYILHTLKVKNGYFASLIFNTTKVGCNIKTTKKRPSGLEDYIRDGSF